MKKWTVSWNLSDFEYLISFQTEGAHSEIAWIYAPHHASFPKTKVFECVDAQLRHFEAGDTFEIDGQEFGTFAELIAYLRATK